MKVALDVHYGDDCAAAAAVCFDDWTADEPIAEHTALTRGLRAYEPGNFFQRELPPLIAALELLQTPPSLLIVDAYVWLGHDRPGLGWHLHRALDRRVAVVGVAKNPFAGNLTAVELTRGQSKRPLFITAVGVDLEASVAGVRSMAGDHRLPTLLSRADRLARERLSEASTSR